MTLKQRLGYILSCLIRVVISFYGAIYLFNGVWVASGNPALAIVVALVGGVVFNVVYTQFENSQFGLGV